MQTAPAHLAPNVYMPMHPILNAKVSQLRSCGTDNRALKMLIHELTTFITYEALRQNMHGKAGPGKGVTPTGQEYEAYTVTPTTVTIVPIMRSGLSMVEAIQQILPSPVPVHHLGILTDRVNERSVEYYNNLGPFNAPNGFNKAPELAIVCDPVICTGETVAAALDNLKKWGVKKVLVIAILAAPKGLDRAVEEWPEGCELWIGSLEKRTGEDGVTRPGMGDIGDRLFMTYGK